jgi:hypothetical protein
MKSTYGDTATAYQKIKQHQPVLILTSEAGKTWRGIVLSPGPIQSFVRFNQDGVLRETRLENKRLIPVRIKS